MHDDATGAGRIPHDELEAGLREGQFEAMFQPKVEMRSRRVQGAEAVARWRHPREGLLEPAAFLQSLERTALIEELTAQMLAAAAFNCRMWREAGLDVSVAVNLSNASLADASLGGRLAEIVRRQGLRPQHVTCDVTESAAMSESPACVDTLVGLRREGFGLAIDGYRNGAASVARVTDLAFTELKFERAFLRDAASHAASHAVLRSGLAVARDLGISAVAEGVETHEQWQLALGLDCPVAQGYLIARPMEAGAFLDWIRLYGLGD